MGKYCSGLGITSTRLEQTMCSPWEEAAQPGGRGGRQGLELSQLASVPAWKRMVGVHGGYMGGRKASLTLRVPPRRELGPSPLHQALQGQGDAERAGCVPSSP